MEKDIMDCGFAIITTDEHVVGDNARDLDIELTDAVWETLSEDFIKIEQNAFNYIKSKIYWMRDEGHDRNGDLIGSCGAERGTSGYDFIMYHSEQNRDGWDGLRLHPC